jgi:ribonucleoside-diphosphate reductase alpha chain
MAADRRRAEKMIEKPEARRTRSASRTKGAVVVVGRAKRHPGLRIPRFFSNPDTPPFDQVEWEERTASITGEKGKVYFEQKDIEVPRAWSQTATNVVAQKYFRGVLGSPAREKSVRQLLGRVASTLARWGEEDGYFAAPEEGRVFHDELCHLLVNQKMSFNSPVWFNVGLEEHPQCSACFINSVEDSMESILTLAKTEGMLFKWGSGTGTNFSSLRSSKEALAGGGTASGPVSFMKGFDAFAGVIKSGGKTRRAAKMVILNADHPDIVEFVNCKAAEERKVWALIEAGYDSSFNGEAYASVFFQNSNNSVRVSDEFMEAVSRDGDWHTRSITTGQVVETFRARKLFNQIAMAAHQCGDPGLQFDTTVNAWHTCPSSGRINASNPCVTGDTLVATAEGLLPIRDLVGRPRVDIVAQDGELAPVTEVFRTGVKPVYRLRTRSGYTLKVTGDHPITTANRGDVPAGELRPGDELCLVPGRFGAERLFTSMAELTGMLLGDGCKAGEQGQLVLTMGAHEADILAEYVDYLNSVKPDRKIGGVTRSPTGVRVATSAREITEVVDRYAVLDQGSTGKRLTDAAFRLDRDSTSALLRGLFTTDGTVGFTPDHNAYVSLDSSSLDLLRQVQQLLLGFGIKAKLYENRRGGAQTSRLPDGHGGQRDYPVSEMHALRISRNSRVLFERWIGFHPRSEKALRLREMNATVGAYHDPLTDAFDGLEPLGEEEVFDLCEPRTHHFVAGGLLVHNCSEFMFLDDSACNLASLNLMRFVDDNGEFDVEAFRHAVEITVLAQEIMVSRAKYPTDRITENSQTFRPLGLGYANLGALLMARGLPYDSEPGRAYAAAVTSIMTGHAYAMSARIARDVTGPFDAYEPNRDPMLGVLEKHRRHVDRIDAAYVPYDLVAAARSAWDEALTVGREHGYRNAQVTVLAPTGTIGFMMDCDTTGIEPPIALVAYKKLVGGGIIKIVSQTVPMALQRLGYPVSQAKKICDYIEEAETIEGAPGLKEEHLPVFDCAFRSPHGTRCIHYLGHVRMMAAVQPFLSGAISKTVNLPNDATVADIEDAYLQAWKLGLKAIAVYRDGCKMAQPLSTKKAVEEEKKQKRVAGPPAAVRRKLPDERRSLTHKFSVGGHEGYLHVGLYEDGCPGEIFIRMAKEGSTIAGLMDSFATAISISLQHGVPLKLLTDKFAHTRFDPSGFTGNPDVPRATSLMDYIFRWLALKFVDVQQPASDELSRAEAVAAVREMATAAQLAGVVVAPAPKIETITKPNGNGTNGNGRVRAVSLPRTGFVVQESDAPACHECGSIMVRSGACHKCQNCGATSGCS